MLLIHAFIVSGGLPEICDIDVGLINNMIQRRLLDDAR
jgi:hypothetical protein